MARRRALGGISTVTTALGNILSASCSGTEELVNNISAYLSANVKPAIQ
jgi:hypothetical protein